jgi:hypothetical protein
VDNMTVRLRPALAIVAISILIGSGAGAVVTASAVHAADPAPQDVHACVDNATGALRLIADPAGHPSQAPLACSAGTEHELDWNLAGQPGPTGLTGPAGPTGAAGVTSGPDPAALTKISGALASMSSELSSAEAKHAARQKQAEAIGAKIRALLRSQPSSGQLRTQLRTWLGKRAADDLLTVDGFGSGPTGNGSPAAGALTRTGQQAFAQQSSFDLMYLQLQSEMQDENRSYAAVSNIMKTKADTIRNSISNIR